MKRGLPDTDNQTVGQSDGERVERVRMTVHEEMLEEMVEIRRQISSIPKQNGIGVYAMTLLFIIAVHSCSHFVGAR